uniref:Hint domain-containing protein n=1 Tax=Lotharella oceanica TaxID=641309 RepID=A0A7S2XBM3_9EUKA
MSPTSSPTTISPTTAAPSSDGSNCFHGDSLVELASGESRPISSIRIGDRVRVTVERGDTAPIPTENTRLSREGHPTPHSPVGGPSSVYAAVVFVPHAPNQRPEDFVEIQTQGGHTLRVTREHLIPARLCDRLRESPPASGDDGNPPLASRPHAIHLMRAEDIRERDMCVSTMTKPSGDRVTSVRVQKGKGVYTIVTEDPSGYVVVDGVRASSFGVNHFWANAYYDLHRAGFRWLPRSLLGCKAVVSFNNLVGAMVLAARNAVVAYR